MARKRSTTRSSVDLVNKPNPESVLNIALGFFQELGIYPDLMGASVDIGDVLEAGTYGASKDNNQDPRMLFKREEGRELAKLCKVIARTGAIARIGDRAWRIIDSKFPYTFIGTYAPARGVDKIGTQAGPWEQALGGIGLEGVGEAIDFATGNTPTTDIPGLDFGSPPPAPAPQPGGNTLIPGNQTQQTTNPTGWLEAGGAILGDILDFFI